MDQDPGGPKTCGSGGSGSATLIITKLLVLFSLFLLLLNLQLAIKAAWSTFILYTSMTRVISQPTGNLSHIPSEKTHGTKRSGTVRVVPGKATGDEKGDETEG